MFPWQSNSFNHVDAISIKVMIIKMRQYDVTILHVTYFCISGIVNTPHRDNLGPSFVSKIRQKISKYMNLFCTPDDLLTCFLLDIINTMCWNTFSFFYFILFSFCLFLFLSCFFSLFLFPVDTGGSFLFTSEKITQDNFFNLAAIRFSRG